jgi:phenylpropionate dioxygenase-like ring-hydroxylating dioxygenase large terminal subunit
MTPVTSRSVDQRFSFPPYPNGWAQAAWSHELRRGQVKPLTCFGQDLVLFRGDDGKARILDAYCPHLGANLAVGGTVAGDQIRCPFHGWQFDGAGECKQINYACKIPPKARLRSWPVHEANGLIMIWYDADGRDPWFEIPTVPEFGSRQWTRPHYFEYKIKTRWREILENGVDRAHFHALHRYPRPPELDFRTDGPRFSMTSHVPWRRFGREVTVQLNIDSYGPGLQVNRGVGELPFLVLGAPLPLDPETVLHRMTFIVSKKLPFPLSELAVRLVIWMAVREFKRDLPIWENKIELARPVLCEGDGPIPKFRAWCKQFYSEETAVRHAALAQSGPSRT